MVARGQQERQEGSCSHLRARDSRLWGHLLKHWMHPPRLSTPRLFLFFLLGAPGGSFLCLGGESVETITGVVRY